MSKRDKNDQNLLRVSMSAPIVISGMDYLKLIQVSTLIYANLYANYGYFSFSLAKLPPQYALAGSLVTQTNGQVQRDVPVGMGEERGAKFNFVIKKKELLEKELQKKGFGLVSGALDDQTVTKLAQQMDFKIRSRQRVNSQMENQWID